jgi:hypothetical protein
VQDRYRQAIELHERAPAIVEAAFGSERSHSLVVRHLLGP